MEFSINKKIVDIYYNENSSKYKPVVILNTFNNEGKEIWSECQKHNINEFILVTISNLDWNNDLTPWECMPLYNGDSKYLGYADTYLNEIEKEIIPKINNFINNDLDIQISYYILAGYSLAGLFALYSGFKSNVFNKIICVSGSLWYPHILEFVYENNLNKNINEVYLSLGNKEANSKIQILSTVHDNTIKIYNHINKNVKCIYEENDGNHFKDTTFRMVKAIKHVLE